MPVYMTEQQNAQRDTEALILQAAEKEFLEKGYSGAKTTTIAEAAGVTHAMFHYYFRTKDKLFEKIVADKLGKLMEMMFSAIGNSDLPLKERIVQGVERHFDFVAANPLLPRFIFNEVHNRPERLDGITSLLDNLQSAIDKDASINKCRHADARMVLLDIISLNIFPFVAQPIVNVLLDSIDGNSGSLLEMRKKENVKTILEKLNIE